MQNFYNSDLNPIYNIIEASRFQLEPYRMNLVALKYLMEAPFSLIGNTETARYMKAFIEVSERVTRKYHKPNFNINLTIINDKEFLIEEEVIITNPFCKLLHFKKLNFNDKLPKMLIVAPLAGHHATLLKKTVSAHLPFYDVYITDWIDACQVPVIFGKFDMNDYVDYLIEFMRFIEEPAHILAVCQPTIPVLAAASIMSSQKMDPLPKSLILIGGPIDARVNPSQVNNYANEKTIEWFEETVICKVPLNYPGAGRKVYPGFLQLAGFVSLNWKKHLNAHLELFKNIASNDSEKSDYTTDFYDEYLSVMDLPAEFFIQTVDIVFQKYSLAKGELFLKGQDANVSNIKKIPILGIEGENDDIASVGQTKAVLELCNNVPDELKAYHLQKGVGHYGVFSGSKFNKHIIPVIRKFTENADKNYGKYTNKK